MKEELEKEILDKPFGKSFTKTDLLEQLAELEHKQWIKWSQNVIEQATKDSLSSTDSFAVRNNVLEMHQRWLIMWKDYFELTEEQKEQDRIWARKVLELTQSKIISIINKRIEELKEHESNEIEYFDPTTSETEDIIKELESLKKEVNK